MSPALRGVRSRPPSGRVIHRPERGFTLIEIAVGLTIMGLVMTGMLLSLSQQTETRRIADTRTTMAKAREAVQSFVLTQGRLPCPASATSAGREDIASTAGGLVTCSLEAGFLPAVTLGLADLDSNGLLNSAWSVSNAGTFPRAFRYAVSSLEAPVAQALTSASLGAPGSSTRRAEVQAVVNAGGSLFVCASATGVTGPPNRCGVNSNLLSANAAVVIWNLGANALDTAAYSADEQQNATVAAARVFIHRDAAPQGAVGGMYDDLVTWIPYSAVAERLLIGGFVQ